jgi:uncharacterized protein YdhG (YjbR/CyaY superfamily)
MQSRAATVEEYLNELEPNRRQALEAVRQVLQNNLPSEIEETMQYGMIGYVIPLSVYPNGYLNDKKTPLPFVHLASQKNHMALYMMCVYSKPEIRDWFTTQYKKTGKKLDMGKSCIRFKKLDDLPLEVIGETVKKLSVDEYVTHYEKSRGK